MRNLFDTHCHLDDARFDEDREALVSGLPQQGISYCVTVGSDIDSSGKSIALAQRYDFLYAAAGVHPHAAAQAPGNYLQVVGEQLGQKKVVALGEIGLDYHYDFSPRDLQRHMLGEQLELAYKRGLPVILHVREAHGDMLALLRERGSRHAGGIIHCFSGSRESAMEYAALGYMISFAGSLTFKNAAKLQAAAQALPSEVLLVETDSPYLAPVPMRGKRNCPAYVAYVCAFLAQLRGMGEQETADLCCRNAKRLFGIA